MPVLLSALGRIGRVLAHDLRNPLGAIRNACHVLRQQLPSSDPVWIDYLSLIDQQAADCDRLLARRLGWSRTWEIAPATVEVGPWLRALLADTTLPSPVKPLLQVVPADLRIVTDPQRLRLILETLIRNATDALQDARGQLSVTVQHRGLEIVLIVADNGPGIPAPIRPILFEPLASTKPSGLGLGLWIARQLAQQLGGSLTWEPTAEGTTMVVTVPPLLAGTF
jgi:signal transduction histidine kinase